MPKNKGAGGSRAVRTIAKNVKRYRLHAGMSRQALSRACRLRYTYIGRLERRRVNPTSQTFERIADVLGATLEQFVAGC